MAYALHETDEETDVGAYGAYLRAQSDGDLLDIAGHLDPARYPARLDAARREIRRRRVLHMPVYTAQEYTLRYVALSALLLAALTISLALLLTPSDISGPPWPQGVPDGVSVLVGARLYGLALLRGAVTACVRLGVYDIALAYLAYWTLSRGHHLARHQARADVWRLALTAWAVLAASVLLSSGPASPLPDLYSTSDGGARLLTLLNPFSGMVPA